MADVDATELLAAYDAQVRAHEHDHAGDVGSSEWVGPLLRRSGFGHQGWIEYHDLEGLEGDDLDELIARQVRFFAERSQRFEWKLHGHDLPEDLSDRLLAAGFQPEEIETVMVAPLAALSRDAQPPDGVAIRAVTEPVDFERIERMEDTVWGGGDAGSWMHWLHEELVADPESLRVFVAEAEGEVVSAGWIRFPRGTEFGTLWGGATLPAWRSRGIYRALVAHRGRLAAERGRRYLQTDASDDSRPILERIGFVAVTTTTPFVWSPPSA